MLPKLDLRAGRGSLVARWLVGAIAFFGFVGLAAANAVDEATAQEDRIAELERTVAILADELERTRRELAVPEDQPLSSKYGLAPAASKIYGLGRGLSIGGYGEGYYNGNSSQNQNVGVSGDLDSPSA